MRARALILLLPLLAACQSPATISANGGDVPRAPTADKPVCSADAAAAIASEPLPPAGVSRAAVVAALIDALGEDKALAVWSWWTSEYPGWARGLERRLRAVQADCA